MAYMGRGGFSSFGMRGIGGGLGKPDNNDNDNNAYNERRYYRGGLFRMHFYIPLDNTYVIFQMIMTFIIFTVAVIAFFVSYKSVIPDPIEKMKNIILSTHTILILSLLVITLLLNYFSRNINVLIKRLLIILLISIITLITFLGIKIYLNSIYTNNKFEQIYEEKYKIDKYDSKQRVDIIDMKIKNQKEYFIDECMKMYYIFSIKTYGIMILNTLLIVLLIYQIIKVSKIQEKKDRLSKDDAIVYDEEENVKI